MQTRFTTAARGFECRDQYRDQYRDTIASTPAWHTCSRSGREFDALVVAIGRHFRSLGNAPIFRTNADPTVLWRAYLDSFPVSERQYHNCHACRHFIERFGGLAIVDAAGTLQPAVFDDRALDSGLSPTYIRGISAIARYVRCAAIAGVHLDSRRVWGIAVDQDNWGHFSIARADTQLYRGHDAAADAGAVATGFNSVSLALGEWPAEVVRRAASLLETDALYRAEKVRGPVVWLRDLQSRLEGVRGTRRQNLIWLAVAQAPEGFRHPRSGVAATLLDDLARGVSIDTASASFARKMAPDRYQRPQTPPKAGAIDAAEQLVARFGIERSLERRFARLEDCVMLWQPKPAEPQRGVFAALREQKSWSAATVGTESITFAKFRRVVLPTAVKIEVKAPPHGAYGAIVTAVHRDAPPILQWDREECRNPASWYAYTRGSSASSWSLRVDFWVGTWTECTGITLDPAHWGTPTPNQLEAAFFLLRGARETRNPGLALFPEILRGGLHGVRSVIEAYSARGKMQGLEEATACGLIVGSNSYALVRVTDASGVLRVYHIDRWD